jgi:hypothetical protein
MLGWNFDLIDEDVDLIEDKNKKTEGNILDKDIKAIKISKDDSIMKCGPDKHERNIMVKFFKICNQDVKTEQQRYNNYTEDSVRT